MPRIARKARDSVRGVTAALRQSSAMLAGFAMFARAICSNRSTIC
jgi:hypothetical protein